MKLRRASVSDAARYWHVEDRVSCGQFQSGVDVKRRSLAREAISHRQRSQDEVDRFNRHVLGLEVGAYPTIVDIVEAGAENALILRRRESVFFIYETIIRRFAHFPPNLLKSLDGGFAKSASSPLQIIEHKGLIEMTEPRVLSSEMEVWKPQFAGRLIPFL